VKKIKLTAQVYSTMLNINVLCNANFWSLRFICYCDSDSLKQIK